MSKQNISVAFVMHLFPMQGQLQQFVQGRLAWQSPCPYRSFIGLRIREASNQGKIFSW